MSDCCFYYILQKQSNGIWVDIGFDKDSKIVDKMYREYNMKHPSSLLRIQKRKIAEDRGLGRKVPNCC